MIWTSLWPPIHYQSAEWRESHCEDRRPTVAFSLQLQRVRHPQYRPSFVPPEKGGGLWVYDFLSPNRNHLTVCKDKDAEMVSSKTKSEKGILCAMISALKWAMEFRVKNEISKAASQQDFVQVPNPQKSSFLFRILAKRLGCFSSPQKWNCHPNIPEERKTIPLWLQCKTMFDSKVT